MTPLQVDGGYGNRPCKEGFSEHDFGIVPLTHRACFARIFLRFLEVVKSVDQKSSTRFWNDCL